MKATEIPEKIYVPTAGDELHYHMACPNNEFQESIEYIRTDAIIDKACEWWENELTYPSMTPEEIKWYKDKIEDFRKAMKEE